MHMPSKSIKMGMDGKPASDEHERNESYRSVTEYFLTKLKRVDDELNVTNAELREVMEEIRTKDSRINCLKMKLSDLLREEFKKKIKELESKKTGLNALATKANKVLDGLGLIWVGENARRDPMACCTSTNENYISLKRIPPLRKGIGQNHQSHNQINKPKDPVVPFSGVGYRLGTGSEVYGYESDTRLATSSLETQSTTSEKMRENVIPVVERRHGRAKATKNVRNIPVEPVSSRLSSAQYETDDETGRTIIDQPKFRRTKSLEELPFELLLMSTKERQRALKQMSVQIQKNMNKYSY